MGVSRHLGNSSFWVYFSFSCMFWLSGQHPMDQVICDVEVSGQHCVDQVTCDMGVFRHLDSILWIWLSVMWGCADIWATSHGSGCLWCGFFQKSGQHPVDLVVCDVGFFKDLCNIPWIWLSVMWGCADIWATSHGSGCLWCGFFQRSGQHPVDLVVWCGNVQTSGQHPVDLVVSDVGMSRHLGNILWIWWSVMWGCSDIWATSCGSGCLMWECPDIWATSCGSGYLGRRDVQAFQQHPVEVDQLSGTVLMPDTWLTSSGSSCLGQNGDQ